MVTQITSYIDYLKRQHGLQITVHDRTGQLAPYMDALAGYNIHANAYTLSRKKTYGTSVASSKIRSSQSAAKARFSGCVSPA